MEKKFFKTNINCHFCQLFPLCVPKGLSAGEVHALQTSIDQHYVLEKGKTLVRANDPLHYLYALRSGSAKSWIAADHGHERIVDFYLTGEIIGLDAIGKKQHTVSITSLEKSTICRLNYDQLRKVMNQYPHIHSHLLMLASNKLNEHILLLQYTQAEQRLLAFLHDLQKRMQKQGITDKAKIKLSMSRADIGSYLDLTPETVSRIFTRLKKKGILNLQAKTLTTLTTV